MDNYKIEDVFVPVGLPTLTFIKRDNLERSIESWKLSHAKHLLIFGPSKSGKTSLWKKYLREENVIKVPCNNKKSLPDIYNEILDNLGAFYTTEKGKEIGAKLGFLVELTSFLGFVSGKTQVSGEVTGKSSEKEARFSAPPITANTLTKYLKPAKKIIVLEDFHYSNEDLKSLLAQELKAFSDDLCQWIIVGIQHKTSELLSYNLDLHQRIAEIPVEGFTKKELMEILELGELALNFSFSTELKNGIIAESIGSASLVQNIAQRICLIEGLRETGSSKRIIDKSNLLGDACKELAVENKTYYEKVIKNVSQGGRSDGSTEKYKWFLKLIKEKPIPDTGLKNTEIFKYLKDLGHESIEQGSVTSGLSYLPKLLAKQSFPAFFDYDEETKTFYLLDKYMKFVFKWLPNLIDDLFV